MDNVVGVTIVAEGSDGQCNNFGVTIIVAEGKGGYNNNDYYICISEACSSTMMTLRFCILDNKEIVLN